MTSHRQIKVFKFFLTILILVFYAKSVLSKFTPSTSLHIALLAWSFFILFFPIAQGRILIKTPYELLSKSKLNFPELIVWPIAIIINLLTYAFSPSIYLKTYLTTLLFNLLSTPWPYYIMILACFIATFYNTFLQSSTKKYNKKYKAFGVLLTLVSITISIMLVYNEFVIVFNAHGCI